MQIGVHFTCTGVAEMNKLPRITGAIWSLFSLTDKAKFVIFAAENDDVVVLLKNNLI